MPTNGEMELLPCRECGAPCSVEDFEPTGDNIRIWICSQHKMFGGKCPSETAYLTEEAWNARTPSTNGASSETLVEQVARAICATEGFAPDEDLLVGTPHWVAYAAHAKAAITALTEHRADSVDEVERAARALHQRAYPGERWEDAPLHAREEYECDARAVVVALHRADSVDEVGRLKHDLARVMQRENDLLNECERLRALANPSSAERADSVDEPKCPTCGQTNSAFVCSNGFHAPLQPADSVDEVGRLKRIIRQHVDPFDVSPADHALVLAIGTDDEEAFTALTEHRADSVDEVERLREEIEPLLRFHETGGHEGDGSDARLAAVRAALANPSSKKAPASRSGG